MVYSIRRTLGGAYIKTSPINPITVFGGAFRAYPVEAGTHQM